MGHRKYKPRNAKTSLPRLNGLIWLELGGVILLGLAGLAFWRGEETSPGVTPAVGGAKLKVDRPQAYLGNVRLVETVAVAFELTNVGDKPLQFTEQPYIE